MVMVKDSSPTDTRSSYHSRTRHSTGKNEEEKSDRKSQGSQVSEQNLYRTKERFIRRKDDPRLINPKYPHKVPILQNANYQRSKTITPKTLLDSVDRLPGGILACSNKPQEETLPRLQVEEPELAIQSHSGSCHQVASRGRYLVPPIPRRPSDNCSYKGRLPPEVKTSNSHIGISRVDYQLTKVSFDSSPSVRMVGSPLQPQLTHSKYSQGEDAPASTSSETSDFRRVYNCKESNEVTGYGQLGEPTRRNCQIVAPQDKENNQILQKIELRHSSETRQSYEVRTLQMDFRHPNSPVSGKPPSRSSDPDRCDFGGMGIQSTQLQVLGDIRRDNVLLNKRPGVANSLVLSSNDRREGTSYPDPLRQLSSNCSNQEERFSSLLPIIPLRINLEESCQVPMDPVHLPYQGSLQCDSRSTVKESSDFHRMVSPSRCISDDSEVESQSSDRLICNQPQQSASNIHLPLSRRESSSYRCPINFVGQVESSVHLPSDEPYFEGFGQDNSISTRISNFNNARVTDETLVHGSPTSDDSLETHRSTSTTDSSRQASSQSNSYETSRVETLRTAYEKRFPNCSEGINLMIAPLRKNSIGDYQAKWIRFIDFLKSENIRPDKVSISDVIRFLVSLFKSNLKATTVNHYKTALTKPILAAFNIDIKTQELSDLIRSMQIVRPSLPSVEPQWNLNKVLNHINVNNLILSDRDLLRKSAFLLLLATGWRISELHACVRSDDYCKFSNSSLRIRPHPNFLAKNEKLSNRWKTKNINSLVLNNGGISRLCPVATLRSYLQRSKRDKDGPLFQLVSMNAKPLTKHNLSTEICKLILEADPDAKAKVHDVRKYASSYSLAETMVSPEELSRSIGWNSPATFFKYYMSSVEPLDSEVMLPMPGPADRHR